LGLALLGSASGALLTLALILLASSGALLGLVVLVGLTGLLPAADSGALALVLLSGGALDD